MTRKSMIILLVALLATAVLAACGSSEPAVVEVTRVVEVESEPQTVEVEVTRVVEIEGETVIETVTEIVEVTPVPEEEVMVEKPTGKIVLWGWSFGPMFDTGLVEEFNEEYPDIEVEWVNYATADTYQNLQLALAGVVAQILPKLNPAI